MPGELQRLPEQRKISKSTLDGVHVLFIIKAFSRNITIEDEFNTKMYTWYSKMKNKLVMINDFQVKWFLSKDTQQAVYITQYKFS